MKWSFFGVAVIVAGLIGLAILILFQDITSTNEQDYYLLKETTEAAMIDSVDIAYYRSTGVIKIVQEKFVENFTRRFAESTNYNSDEYTIKFYDIIEVPPKVSITIQTNIGTYNIVGDAEAYNVANQLDAILEREN